MMRRSVRGVLPGCSSFPRSSAPARPKTPTVSAICRVERVHSAVAGVSAPGCGTASTLHSPRQSIVTHLPLRPALLPARGVSPRHGRFCSRVTFNGRPLDRRAILSRRGERGRIAACSEGTVWFSHGVPRTGTGTRRRSVPVMQWRPIGEKQLSLPAHRVSDRGQQGTRYTR